MTEEKSRSKTLDWTSIIIQAVGVLIPVLALIYTSHIETQKDMSEMRVLLKALEDRHEGLVEFVLDKVECPIQQQ